MITAERKNLIPIKVLISNPSVHVELFEDNSSNLFLSATSAQPEGTVYFATTSALLYSFVEDRITLQALFDKTPSFFVEITDDDKSALYSLNDMDVELECGEKTIKELGNEGMIEVWD